MVRRIIALGFIGWGLIVALAWGLAERRVSAQCGESYPPCLVQRGAVADATLLFGLTVALIAAIIVALLWARTLPSPSTWRRAAKPAEPTRLR